MDNTILSKTDLKSDKTDSMQSGEGYDSEDVDQENPCPNMLNDTLSITLTQDNIEDETSTSTSYKPRRSLLLNFDPLFCKNTPTRNCSLNLTRIHENDNIDSLTNQFSNICINKVDNNVSSSECRLHQQKEYLKIINLNDTLGNISNNTQNLNETVDLSSGSDIDDVILERNKVILEEEKHRNKELTECIELKQLNESQESCSDLEIKLQKKNRSFENLRPKVEEDKESHIKELVEANELKQQLREFQETCSNLEIQLRKKTESYEGLKQKLEEEVQRLRESEEMCSNLQKQLRDKSESNEELNKKLEEEKNCTQALKQSITNLQTQKNNELRVSLEACSNLQLRLKEKDKDFQELQKKFDEENNTTKTLKTTIQDSQLQINSLNIDLSKCNLEIQNYREIMEVFKIEINKYYTGFQKLKNEHTVISQHLTNSELAFSDVHRCINEIISVQQQYENDINKLNTMIKILEIKNSTFQEHYDQKKKKCIILCDEV